MGVPHRLIQWELDRATARQRLQDEHQVQGRTVEVVPMRDDFHLLERFNPEYHDAADMGSPPGSDPLRDHGPPRMVSHDHHRILRGEGSFQIAVLCQGSSSPLRCSTGKVSMRQDAGVPYGKSIPGQGHSPRPATQ